MNSYVTGKGAAKSFVKKKTLMSKKDDVPTKALTF